MEEEFNLKQYTIFKIIVKGGYNFYFITDVSIVAISLTSFPLHQLITENRLPYFDEKLFANDLNRSHLHFSAGIILDSGLKKRVIS